MITAPGLYLDMPTSEYFSDPAPKPSLTQSIAKILLEKSPLHAWHSHPALGGSVDKAEDYVAAQAIGNAAHKLFLGRGKHVVAIEADNFRTKAAQETRDNIAAEGKVPILVKHYMRAQAMVKAGHKQLDAIGLAPETFHNTEVVAAWQEGDIWLRTMIDALSVNGEMVLDLKTTGMSCAPHGIGRMLTDAGWDIQAAMHERALEAVKPYVGRRRHLFIAQENTEPYALVVAEMSESILTMGRKKLAIAIEIWRRCIQANQWPGYPPEVIVPEMPAWAENNWLDREEVEFNADRLPRGAELIMAG